MRCVAASLFVASLVLLMGAGISRYHARIEGQHLELKLAIVKLLDEIAPLRSGVAKDKSDE